MGHSNAESAGNRCLNDPKRPPQLAERNRREVTAGLERTRELFDHHLAALRRACGIPAGAPFALVEAALQLDATTLLPPHEAERLAVLNRPRLIAARRLAEEAFLSAAGGSPSQISGGLGADFAIFNVATDGSDSIALGRGDDTVNVVAPLAAQQIRLTFTSSEIGNANALDSNTLVGQDGSLAVRLQAEDGAGNLTGLVSRTDDEGMTFVSATVGVTFDVRDLVSGAARGDLFEVMHLGTEGSNRINESAESKAYYINAGMGDDRVQGGLGRDFLVGGLGNDRLKGNAGADSLLGGAGIDTFVFSGAPGNDTIFDFVSGTDKIDLTAFGIGFADLMFTASGANTTIDVDADSDSDSDFQITLLNAAAPAQADFLF